MYIHCKCFQYTIVVIIINFVVSLFSLDHQASDGDTSTSFNTISFEINGIGTQLPFDQ